MWFPVSASGPGPVLEGVDDDMGFSLPPVLAEEKEEPEESVPRPQPRRQVCTGTRDALTSLDRAKFCAVTSVLVLQGNKRQAVEENSSPSSCPADRPSGGRSLPLKARYGIHAWRRWALSASDQSDDTKGKDAIKPGGLTPRVCSYLYCQEICSV